MTELDRPDWLPGTVEWQAVEDRVQLAETLAEFTVQALNKGMAENGVGAIAVSGGSTPLAFFQALSAKTLAWTQAAIALVDERFVPATHSDSNERLVREHLLVNEATRAQFYGMVHPSRVAEGDIDGNVHWVEQQYAQLPAQLDVTVLGMGNDGHTASLFPGAAELSNALHIETPHRVSKMQPKTAPHARITLTAPMIHRSKALVLHIVGEDKLHTVQQALNLNDPARMPIVQFLRGSALQPAPLTIFWSP